jgi:hypothetical protein
VLSSHRNKEGKEGDETLVTHCSFIGIQYFQAYYFTQTVRAESPKYYGKSENKDG